MGIKARGYVLSVFVGLSSGPISAQEVPTSSLIGPTAVLTQGFTRIAGIRELRDGRVVLLDADDRSVHVVAAGLRGLSPVGRTGSGPGEYQLPSRLFALQGDSTAILDSPNGRLLVVTPDAVPGGIIDLRYASGASGTRPTAMPVPMESDARGRFYSQASPIAANANGESMLVDSAAIVRWVPDGPRDTAGYVAVDNSRRRLMGGITASTPRPPFSPVARWTVSRGGRVAVVYPEPFHVVFFSNRGERHVGPSISYEPIKLTEIHKEAYREEAERPRPRVTVSLRDRSSAIATTRWPFQEPDEWPDFLPPFTSQAVLKFAPDGNLWLERTVPDPGQQLRYDVIDSTGVLVGRVLLAPETRLVGFGVDAVYVVRRDEMDLEYLERYPMPIIQTPGTRISSR